MKQFKELSLPLQKRRIIKDAIKQIDMGIVIPEEGTYFSLQAYYDTKDLQKILQEKGEETCTACAKGALFAACVLNVNRVKTTDDIESNSFQVKKLKKWFSPLELDMIETAFEREVISDQTGEINKYIEEEGVEYDTIGDRCIAFGDRYNDDKERLLGILDNVLQNKVFTP